MVLSLTGKVALVTGGSRGIGAATVRLLRQAGARVVFSYRNASDRAQALVGETGGPGMCRGMKQELSSVAEGRALVEAAASVWGQLDILIVNHGVWPPHDQPIGTMPDAQWRRTLGVNLDSVFGLVAAAAAHMGRRDPGVGSTEEHAVPSLPEPAPPGSDEAALPPPKDSTDEIAVSLGTPPSQVTRQADAPARELVEETVFSDRVHWPSLVSPDARRVLQHGVAGGRVHAGVGRGFRNAEPEHESTAVAQPWPVKAARGHIILVASTAAQRGEAFHADYAASKGALLSLTKSLSSELAPVGILCNCVAPGWVRTEMSAGTLNDPDASKKALGFIPLGRAAEPEEIAGPIVFLCTPWAGFISGEIWNVNGGAVLAG